MWAKPCVRDNKLIIVEVMHARSSLSCARYTYNEHIRLAYIRNWTFDGKKFSSSIEGLFVLMYARAKSFSGEAKSRKYSDDSPESISHACVR